MDNFVNNNGEEVDKLIKDFQAAMRILCCKKQVWYAYWCDKT